VEDQKVKGLKKLTDSSLRSASQKASSDLRQIRTVSKKDKGPITFIRPITQRRVKGDRVSSMDSRNGGKERALQPGTKYKGGRRKIEKDWVVRKKARLLPTEHIHEKEWESAEEAKELVEQGQKGL